MSRRNRNNPQANNETEKEMEIEILERPTEQAFNIDDIDLSNQIAEDQLTEPTETAEISVETEVDMGEVSLEDPIERVSTFGKQILAVTKSVTSKVASTSPAKTPILGKRPKSSWPFGMIYVKDLTISFQPHHQKSLIFDMIKELGGNPSVQEIVEVVESNEKYYMRLNSRQSVFDCIVYHTRQLVEVGILGVGLFSVPESQEEVGEVKEEIEIQEEVGKAQELT